MYRAKLNPSDKRILPGTTLIQPEQQTVNLKNTTVVVNAVCRLMVPQTLSLGSESILLPQNCREKFMPRDLVQDKTGLLAKKFSH